MKRVRLVQVVLNAQFVVDDGDTLTPLQPQQWPVAPADWLNVHALLDKAIDELQATLNAEPSEGAAT